MPTKHMILNIVPTAQMRARHSTKDGIVRTHKHAKQKKHEDDIELLLKRHAPKQLSEMATTAVSLKVFCYMPIPKSWTKKKKEEMLGKYHVSKPDSDNLAKNIKDCMTNLGFWEDDCLVAHLEVSKIYSDKPRWEITLEY